MSVSAATLDRLVAPYRRQGPCRSYTASHSPSVRKAMTPIPTFSDWEGLQVGYVEADLVAYCGDTTEGFYLITLVVMDVVTGSMEHVPALGKGQGRMSSAIDCMLRQLPFALRGIDCNNGGEFINEGLMVQAMLEWLATADASSSPRSAT